MSSLIDKLVMWHHVVDTERENHKPRRWTLVNMVSGSSSRWDGVSTVMLESFLRASSASFVRITGENVRSYILYWPKFGVELPTLRNVAAFSTL